MILEGSGCICLSEYEGAAGHDELATIRGLEAEADFGLGAGLMRTELLFELEGRGLAGLVFGPINLGVLQVLEG